ncbi:hypothetical protein C7974DRAFT_410597 [Boeremia exigua]|uniref:uncharacterized protein n=1 Tax=Boeremia exigua TaxID=749465 RepID=UPI001E8D698D|nr:uncharacterized protein C7974DRAFT_410597 [Boeremia exigua]KAH6639639.1 hypothetical protein C7974DRAFT_410597 [Boeremia exigua]
MSGGNLTSNKRLTRRFVGHARAGMALIKIGHESTPYYVHKSLLTQHSEYFQRALNGSWKEAEEGVITLEDVECNTFDIFVEWLYTQKVPKKYSEWLKDTLTPDIWQRKAVQMAIVKACHFGDRFLVSEFGRIVERTFICYIVTSEDDLYYEVIAYAYEHLSTKSLILKAMIDTHCATFTTDMDEKVPGEVDHREILPREFLLGVMLRYAEITQDQDKWIQLSCDYHDHSSLEEVLEDDLDDFTDTEAE